MANNKGSKWWIVQVLTTDVDTRKMLDMKADHKTTALGFTKSSGQSGNLTGGVCGGGGLC